MTPFIVLVGIIYGSIAVVCIVTHWVETKANMEADVNFLLSRDPSGDSFGGSW